MKYNVVAICGPSGVGKSTLAENLTKGSAYYHLPQGYTSRELRPNDDLKHMPAEEFGRHEWLQTSNYLGNRYGVKVEDLNPHAFNVMPLALDGLVEVMTGEHNVCSIYLEGPRRVIRQDGSLFDEHGNFQVKHREYDAAYEMSLKMVCDLTLWSDTNPALVKQMIRFRQTPDIERMRLLYRNLFHWEPKWDFSDAEKMLREWIEDNYE